MKLDKTRITAFAVLAISAALCIYDHRKLLAAASAVFVHEAAHIAALYLLRLEINGFEISLKGLKIEFSEGTEKAASLLAILCGPAAGLVLFIMCEAFFHGDTLSFGYFTGRISLYLSLFNLLPALPLDGGNALALVLGEILDGDGAENLLAVSGFIISLLLIVSGLVFMASRGAVGLSAAGIWILCANNSNADL